MKHNRTALINANRETREAHARVLVVRMQMDEATGKLQDAALAYAVLAQQLDVVAAQHRGCINALRTIVAARGEG